ncbi:glycosyltransferase [Candidatus Pacearchaeota archaeon]|nr:glycosyltransferase [Candidatus Pacearchaeota archaeon]
MNILIITWLFPPSNGGVESYTYNLAKNLSKEHKITILTCLGHYPTEKKEKFKIYRMKEMYPYGRKKEDYGKIYKKVLEILKKEDIDLVHSHNLVCLETSFTKAIVNAVKSKDLPLVDHCHDARFKYLNKELKYEKFDRIIAVSKFVKKRLINLGFNKNILEVIYNSSDSKVFNSGKYSSLQAKKFFRIPLNKKVIIFPSRAIRTTTGEFGEQKNFITLLNSTKLIKKDFGDDFVVIFPVKVGMKRKNDAIKKTLYSLREKLKKDGLIENVIPITKKVGYENMPLLYKTANIMCTPSTEEAFGLVFLEASLMQLPVIGAKSGATKEIVINGKTGFLVPPKNKKRLAKIIVRLLKSKEFRDKIGKAGRKYVKDKFDSNKMLTEVERTYKKVLENRKVIYLVRHPETKNNRENRLTGWEHSQYTSEGNKQFAKISNYFKDYQGQIFSSDLKRTSKLAVSIAKKNGIKPIITPLLRERNFKETLPHHTYETESSVAKRTKKFYDKYHPRKAIIFTHGAILRHIARHYLITNRNEFEEPRNVIFKIETNKNAAKLKKIRL